MKRIYLDNNSTTPVDASVLELMLPYFSEAYANPNSSHSFGGRSRQAVEEARAKVAELVAADPGRVLFTSSATESINTVFNAVKGGQVIVSSVEHAATLECGKRLMDRGVELITVPVDQTGQLDIEALRQVITANTSLVSMIWANNETGAIFSIEEIAKLCSNCGVPLHVDAVQAAGKLPISLVDIPVNYLSISSHKIFGPKGAAALIVSAGAPFLPLIVGGGQEQSSRAGTENVPAIVGFGEAARLAKQDMVARIEKVCSLRDRLEYGILERISRVYINGDPKMRLPNTSNLGFEGVDGDTLVSLLDVSGIYASTGSACHSQTISPSHVILAMYGSYEKAGEAVRFSLSHLNTESEVDEAIAATISAISSMQ